MSLSYSRKLHLTALGLQNERYAGPAYEQPAGPLGANPQYLEDGVHVRWAFEPELGWPKHGFFLYRRKSSWLGESGNYVRLEYGGSGSSATWSIGPADGLGALITQSMITSVSPKEVIVNWGTAFNAAAVLVEYRPVSTAPSPFPAGAVGATGLSVQDDDTLVPVTSLSTNIGGTIAPASDSIVLQSDYLSPYVQGVAVVANPATVQWIDLIFIGAVSTYLTAAVNPGQNQTASVADTSNLVPGMWLRISSPGTDPEHVKVKTVPAGTGTFTADFGHPHAAHAGVGDLPVLVPPVNHAGGSWNPGNWGWEVMTEQGTGQWPELPPNPTFAQKQVLPGSYPASWDTRDAGQTTAQGIVNLYAGVQGQNGATADGIYSHLARMSGDPSGKVIDPTTIVQLDQKSAPPGQAVGSTTIRMMDVLLAMSVDHYVARMLGLAALDKYDPTRLTKGQYDPYDYLVAYVGSPGDTPDFYTTTFNVGLGKRQHLALPSPLQLHGTQIEEGFEPPDDSIHPTKLTPSGRPWPALGLTWNLGQDPNSPSSSLQGSSPIAFNLYRKRRGSSAALGGPINQHPIVVPRVPDPINGGTMYPHYFYVDSGPDSASPGGHGMLSGIYSYQMVGIDIFGRISALSPSTLLPAPILPVPAAPIGVTAKFLNAADPFLTSIETQHLVNAGGTTADVSWHWMPSVRTSGRLNSFHIYAMTSLPKPAPVTIISSSQALDGTVTVILDSTPPLLAAAIGGRLQQGGYGAAVELLQKKGDLGIPANIEWLITAAHAGSGGATLTLQSPPDKDGAAGVMALPPAPGQAHLAYNLASHLVWSTYGKFVANVTAPTVPTPATRLLADAAGGATKVYVANPDGLSPNGIIHIGSETAAISTIVDQLVTLKRGLARFWPAGTPVSTFVLAAAAGRNTPLHGTSIILSSTVGLTVGTVVEVGMRQDSVTVTTSLNDAIVVTSGGPIWVTPLSMDGITVGQTLIIGKDSGAEQVEVLGIRVSTDNTGRPIAQFQANFQNSHAPPVSITVGVPLTETTIPHDIVASTGTQMVRPASMENIAFGSQLIVDVGAASEAVSVNQVYGDANANAVSFDAVLTKNHAAGAPIIVACTQLTRSVASGSATATPRTMLNIVPGVQLVIGAGNSYEIVIVTSVTLDSHGTPQSFGATFQNAHGIGEPIALYDAVVETEITSISGTTASVYPPLDAPFSWPALTPVSVVDVPFVYTLKPSDLTSLHLLPDAATNQIRGGGYFGVSALVTSPQSGVVVEGVVSLPARLVTVSHDRPAAPPPPTKPPPCINRTPSDAADINGVSRIKVPLPQPPPASPPSFYAEVWRASEEQVFAFTGQTLDTSDTCQTNVALVQQAMAAIDYAGLESGFTQSQTTLARSANVGDTSVTIASGASVAAYRTLAFVDSNGVWVQRVTIKPGQPTPGSGQTTVSFVQPLKQALASGIEVLVLSQGMGPFTLVSKEPIPWTPTATFVDEVHGLSDNVYFYTVVAVPVQTNTGNVTTSGHQVQGSGVRSAPWPITSLYSILPTRPPAQPAPVRAIPGPYQLQTVPPGTDFTALKHNQILLYWNYDPPPRSQLANPPGRAYAIYRTTSPDTASDIRLMGPPIHLLEFTPYRTTLTSSVNAGPGTVSVAALPLLSSTSRWFVDIGTLLTVDTGLNSEIVVVQSVNRANKTITAVFKRSHASGAPVTGGTAFIIDGADIQGGIDWSLMGATDYYYRIVATDDLGNSSPPSDIVHVRPIDQNPPETPTNLKGVWSFSSFKPGVQLTWSNPRPDLTISVQRLDPGQIIWRTLPGNALNATSYLDISADRNASAYTYRLLVRTASGFTNYSNHVTVPKPA